MGTFFAIIKKEEYTYDNKLYYRRIIKFQFIRKRTRF